VLPAGTGHKRDDSRGALLVIGAYPPGQENYDLRRGDPAELPEARRNIAAVGLPEADPVVGTAEPSMFSAWTRGGSAHRT
jgi:uncharacterized protein YjlB